MRHRECELIVSSGITLNDNQLAVPTTSLVLARTETGEIAICDMAQMGGDEEGPKPVFVLSVEGFVDWRNQLVDANRHSNGTFYGPNDLARERHANLVTTDYVDCRSHRRSGFWCIWNKGDETGHRYDFLNSEVNALVAFMATPDFLEFMKHASCDARG
jgi:hypothetical protein